MLSLLGLIGLAGFGQIYLGQVKRGVTILMVGIVLGLISFFILEVFDVLALFYGIWTIFDAYRLAKRYNAELSRTGRPPW